MCKVYYIVHGGTGGCVERGVWILSRPALSSYTPPCGPAAQIYSECINRTLFGHYPHISVLIEAQQFTSTVWVRTGSPPFRILGKNRTLSPPAGPRPRGRGHQTKKMLKCLFVVFSRNLVSWLVFSWNVDNFMRSSDFTLPSPLPLNNVVCIPSHSWTFPK